MLIAKPLEHTAMKRRALLAGIAGLVTTPSFARRLRPHPLRVGVVGAGILGTSIALHLAESGAEVTLLEAHAPARGATQNSYAWLNGFVSDPHYRDLRLASLARWRWLDAHYGLGISWGGYLNWGDGDAGAALVRENAAQLAGSAAPITDLAVEDIGRYAPYLTPGPVSAAIFAPNDGHIDPVAVTEQLLTAAQRAGARLLCPSRVEGLHFQNGRLKAASTSSGYVEFDRLVIAAGTATPTLTAMAGTPIALAHAPGILSHTRPVDPFTLLTHEGPGEANFKQLPSGHIVAYDAPRPPDLAAHAGIRGAEMDYPSEALRREHGERMLMHLSRFCPKIRVSDFERLTLGFRPMPVDDRPIVGALKSAPDIHVAVTHSGVTLAAILGRLVSSEVLSGTRSAVLSPYRPERFG
jgi:glycine/D-amino acid oxidase-like deaminating enzyme